MSGQKQREMYWFNGTGDAILCGLGAIAVIVIVFCCYHEYPPQTGVSNTALVIYYGIQALILFRLNPGQWVNNCMLLIIRPIVTAIWLLACFLSIAAFKAVGDTDEERRHNKKIGQGSVVGAVAIFAWVKMHSKH